MLLCKQMFGFLHKKVATESRHFCRWGYNGATFEEAEMLSEGNEKARLEER